MGCSEMNCLSRFKNSTDKPPHVEHLKNTNNSVFLPSIFWQDRRKTSFPLQACCFNHLHAVIVSKIFENRESSLTSLSGDRSVWALLICYWYLKWIIEQNSFNTNWIHDWWHRIKKGVAFCFNRFRPHTV